MSTVLSLPYFYWCLALLCAVPIAIVFLNECIDRSKRRAGRYSNDLLMIRDIILPLLVLVIMLRYIFNVDEQNLPTRLFSTILWLALIVAVFRVTRKVIGSGNYSPDDWQSLVPHMFLRLPPYTIMGFIVFHIIQNLWSFPVREMATTLGIGSIVIAFALQDTLSNLVSGVLLVANSPFKTGDWVKVGDVEGQISAVNWRYTNIETSSGNLIVIPNGSIAGESILNHCRPERSTSVTQHFTFSFEHSPNKIRRLFDEVFRNTPGILSTPSPNVAVVKIDDPSMEYKAEFWVKDYGEINQVLPEFMSRIWYALRRHDVSLPTPVYHIHSYSGVNQSARLHTQSENLKDCLDWLPNFRQLPQATRKSLSAASHYKPYAENEIVTKKNEIESGVCVIVTGSVTLDTVDPVNTVVKSETLYPGDLFGETGLFGRAISPFTVTALEDSEIICIPHDLINDTINRNADFAAAISSIIDHRRAHREHFANQPDVIDSDKTLPSLYDLAGQR